MMLSRRGRSRCLAGGVVLALMVVTFTPSPATAFTGTTTRASVSSEGGEATGPTVVAAISANGRYVAFASEAPDLVPGDTNGTSDIFVHDNKTGVTSRVNLTVDGTQTANFRPSTQPAISADGRFVAFTSHADNLVPGDNNRSADIFVRDRGDGSSANPPTTERVSVNSIGAEASQASKEPAISADGRFVAFVGGGNNLVCSPLEAAPTPTCDPTIADTNGNFDIFVRDRQAGTTTRVSVASDGSEVGGSRTSSCSGCGSEGPTISADGRYVGFWSKASGLDPADTNPGPDVFVRDRQTATTNLVSTASNGMAGNDGSYLPDISADGRYVAFSSYASNLVAGDTNEEADAFVHDRNTGATTRVNVSSSGAQASGDSDSFGPMISAGISANGRHVVLLTDAPNLVPGDTNGLRDVFVHDRQTATTTLMSVAGDGTQADGHSADASISGDGRSVAFDSLATNLVPGDTNNVSDVFVRSLPKVPRSLSIADATVTEGEAGTRAVFVVTLSKPSTSWVYVNYATAKSTAVGTDFTAKSGTLGFAPGTTSRNVKVAITPDTLVEGTETFSVKLSTPTGAVIADGIGVGTIIDDD